MLTALHVSGHCHCWGNCPHCHRLSGDSLAFVSYWKDWTCNKLPQLSPVRWRQFISLICLNLYTTTTHIYIHTHPKLPETGRNNEMWGQLGTVLFSLSKYLISLDINCHQKAGAV